MTEREAAFRVDPIDEVHFGEHSRITVACACGAGINPIRLWPRKIIHVGIVRLQATYKSGPDRTSQNVTLVKFHPFFRLETISTVRSPLSSHISTDRSSGSRYRAR